MSFASFCLHAFALHLGALAVVQPVVVSGIVLAVPIRAALTRRRPPTGELVAVVVAAVGLGAFLVAAGSMRGEPGSLGVTTVLFELLGVTGAGVIHVLAGRTRSAPVRAGLYGVVAGVLFGLVGVAINQQAYRVGALSRCRPTHQARWACRRSRSGASRSVWLGSAGTPTARPLGASAVARPFTVHSRLKPGVLKVTVARLGARPSAEYVG